MNFVALLIWLAGSMEDANMPTPISAEQVARTLLDYFKSIDARVGRVMGGNNIAAFQAKHKLTSDELIAGLEYADGQGWIANAPNDAIELTEAGFAAM